jgi:hypothetical protein
MYFTTFNHYDDDAIYYDDDAIYYDETCLICWEPSTANNYIYKMKSFTSSSYYTSCSCNGKFHHDCLFKWINMAQSCPICRIKIEPIVDENPQLPLTFNIFILLFKYLFLFCLLKTIFDIQYSVEKYTHEYQCIQD